MSGPRGAREAHRTPGSAPPRGGPGVDRRDHPGQILGDLLLPRGVDLRGRHPVDPLDRDGALGSRDHARQVHQERDAESPQAAQHRHLPSEQLPGDAASRDPQHERRAAEGPDRPQHVVPPLAAGPLPDCPADPFEVDALLGTQSRSHAHSSSMRRRSTGRSAGGRTGATSGVPVIRPPYRAGPRPGGAFFDPGPPLDPGTPLPWALGRRTTHLPCLDGNRREAEQVTARGWVRCELERASRLRGSRGAAVVPRPLGRAPRRRVTDPSAPRP